MDAFWWVAIGGPFALVLLVAERSLRAPKHIPVDRAEKVRRVLAHLQRKPIGELVEGSAYVLEGTVRAIAGVEPLTSPYAGARCLGYHLDVRTYLSDQHAPWHEEARSSDFMLEDATGRVRVVGEGLELAITDGRYSPGDLPEPLRSRVRIEGPFTVEEGLLHAGQRILVCGVLTAALDATNYRDGTPVYTLRATPSFPLVASTDADLFKPRDERIEPAELHKRR